MDAVPDANGLIRDTNGRIALPKLSLVIKTFQCLQIDFSHMPAVGNLKYILTIVDKFSEWPEVFACAKEDAKKR